jgi:fused signal recognition particle receptor
VRYAEKRGIGTVLIDTAGRQETNVNLLEEMKKIVRVVKPDLKIYVGESIVGNAILEQVGEFDAAIGLDGVILTKVDVDEKGGTVFSVAKATKLPILLLGVGQRDEDIKKFDAEWAVDSILTQE